MTVLQAFQKEYASIAVALGCVAVGWFLFERRKSANKVCENEPPVVPDMKPLEFLIKLLAKDGPQFLVTVARDMGESVFRMPGSKLKVFVVGDYQVARTILENPKGTKPWPFYEFFDRLAMGETFFTQNGHRAQHVRKATSLAFSPQNVKRMTDIVEAVLERWITERLEPLYVKPGIPINVDEEMIVITTEVISKVGFDHNLTNEERERLLASLQCATDEFYMLVNPLKKWKWTAWMFPSMREACRAANDIKKLCAKMLDEYRMNPNPSTSTLVHMIACDNEYESDEQRCCDMVAYLFGGFETTAHAIAWTLVQLASHSEEQQNLKGALRQCSSKDEARHCPALKNVIRESLRLYAPGALGSTRTAAEDVKVSGMKVIPAGSVCVMPYYLILRNGNVFDDPDSFVPSRWENPSEESLKAFLPFAAGRRNCQGQALANAELNTILARLCAGYDFTIVEEGTPEYHITIKPAGAKLAVKPAA